MNLDDTQSISQLDSEDVLGATERFAEQCQAAWELGRAARDLPDAGGVENVVVVGMGGSGISGDVVQTLVEPRLPVPWRTFKDYGPLPEWVGRNTLAFVVSYSGDTEETLAAFEELHDRGARAIAISSGGRLAALAAGYGVAHVLVPGGRQPRASLGFLALPLLASLVEVGLIRDCSDDVDDAVSSLAAISKSCNRDIPEEENVAKQLASALAGRTPVIYGGTGLGEVAAYRFKCDLNEYAKSHAFANAIPEMNHNELEAYGSKGAASNDFITVLLRDVDDHERVGLRLDVVKELLRSAGNEVIEVHSRGISRLARMLTLVMLTQLTAIYVGLVNDVDPGPVPAIEEFKSRLADQ